MLNRDAFLSSLRSYRHLDDSGLVDPVPLAERSE
jgi:hypothetical protein